MKEAINMNNKHILASNLSRLMNQNGIDRIKLSTDLNIKYTTLTSWITCQKYPRINNINKLAHYFHVNRADLVDPIGTRMPDNAIIPKGYVKIPIVGSIPCGDPNTAIQETNKYKLVPEFEPHSGYMFLRADGRSMEPEIKDKALVKIHLQHTIENKEIAAVSVNGGDATLKQAVKDDHDKIVMFHPLNSEFNDIFPDSDHICRIIGKAVSVENRL